MASARTLKVVVTGGAGFIGANLCRQLVAHPDVAVARQLVRGGLGSFAHFSGMPGAPATGSPDAAVFERLGAGYDMAHHGMVASSHQQLLPDDFVDRFGVVGPSEVCARRMAELLALGLDRLVVIGGSRDVDPAALLAANARLATEVLPVLRGTRGVGDPPGGA